MKTGTSGRGSFRRLSDLADHGALVEKEIRDKRPNLYKSFLQTRLLVGVVGLLLPTVLIVSDIIGNLHAQRAWPPLGSLSAYYHDPSWRSDWFVGSLWAIGVGLMVYMGTRKSSFSNAVSFVAGFAALVVSLFPTNDGGEMVPGGVAKLHFGAAGVLIVGLGLLCIGFGIFDNQADDPSRGRRWIHYLAAGLIGLAVVLVVVITVFPQLEVGILGSHGVLIAEVVAVYAFAVSWAAKGWELWEYSRKHPAGPDGLSQPGTALSSPPAHS